MSKIKLILLTIIFSISLGVTSFVKNETRVIEKKLFKINKKIAQAEKDLYETELDYSYLSSPKILSDKIKELSLIDYQPMDYSRIYLNFQDFINSKKKISALNKDK